MEVKEIAQADDTIAVRVIHDEALRQAIPDQDEQALSRRPIPAPLGELEASQHEDEENDDPVDDGDDEDFDDDDDGDVAVDDIAHQPSSQQQEQQMREFARNTWAFGEQEAAEAARAATVEALEAIADEEEAAVVAVAAARAVEVEARKRNGSAVSDFSIVSEAADSPLGREYCSVMPAVEQDEVRAWLKEGVMVKKWTAAGGGTRKRKLRLEKIEKKPVGGGGVGSGIDGGGLGSGGHGGSTPLSAYVGNGGSMVWAKWAKGGSGSGYGVNGAERIATGEEGGEGEDGMWRLVLQSGKTKGKDFSRRLSNLREVRGM